MAQWIEVLALSLLWLRSLLGYGFHPWPRNSCMSQVWPKQKQKQNKKQTKKNFICTDWTINTFFYSKKEHLGTLKKKSSHKK